MMRTHWLAGACGVLFSLRALPAQADDAKQQCVAAFEEGQRYRMAGDLQRAIEDFESCKISACPAAAQRECSRLSEAAQAAVPTVHFELTFGAGLPRRPVLLSIDEGQPAAYDGEVVHVNPGKRRFLFECEGCAMVTREITFVEHDSKRKEVKLNAACGDTAATTEQPAPAKSGNCPTPGAKPAAAPRAELPKAPLLPRKDSGARAARLGDVVVFGSAAALATAGGVGFIAFGLDARSGERALTECAPYCSSARIAEVKHNYWLANVSLGTGLFALGGAAVWWFGLRPPSRPAHKDGQWSVELGPINKLTRTF
jgi:hypothetical protein